MSEDLQDALSSGPRTAAELQATLGISQPTLSRLLATRPAQVCRLGRARATRYAWRREVRGLAPSQPLYRITRAGQITQIGTLHVLQGGFWFEDIEQPAASQWFDGLPWFLADMRPQGFLGQRFVRQLSDLGLPESLSDWQDDHALVALACRGEDALGNLILGEASLTRWQETAGADVIALADRVAHYPRLAQAALAGEVTGTSSGGEQPKFTAMVGDGDPYAVIVKFSEPVSSPAGRRWADLLIAEHHALTVMVAAGQPAAQTEIIEAGDRVFLQTRRFDREDLRGRSGLISLGAIDDEFVGRRQHWLDTATALAQQGRLSAESVARVAWQQAFAVLIGNTDRHFGNLSVCYEGRWPAEVAPAYDMLPMLDAPVRGELPERIFAPVLPLMCGETIARDAAEAAVRFWQQVAEDARVSPGYRACAEARGYC
ncbi:MAG: type II toxin-antitoxin system HipA family toxin YjjJ [Pseudomonadota bacterium]